MNRALLAFFCSFILLVQAGGAMADQAFDQDMASRYLRAAQAGDDEAQFYLGSLYSAGVGVPRSDQEAVRWFGRAATQGHSHAMLILAGLYATGRGVAKNNAEAYKLAYIVNGASRVDEFRNGSRQLMGVLETRMSAQDISQAKASAANWRAVVTSRPAPTAPPADDYSRAAPPAPAAPQTAAPQTAAPQTAAPSVATAAPAATAPPPSPTPQPSKSSSTDNPMDAFTKNFSKDDVDDFLREMPRLRRKYGF
jgi:Sel1 repeat